MNYCSRIFHRMFNNLPYSQKNKMTQDDVSINLLSHYAVD